MVTREKKTLKSTDIVMTSNRHFNIDLNAFPERDDIIDNLQDKYAGQLDIIYEGDGTYTIKSRLLEDLIAIANNYDME